MLGKEKSEGTGLNRKTTRDVPRKRYSLRVGLSRWSRVVLTEGNGRKGRRGRRMLVAEASEFFGVMISPWLTAAFGQPGVRLELHLRR